MNYWALTLNVTKRAQAAPDGADVPVSHDEMIALKITSPHYIYPAPEGYDCYFLGRRIVETEPAQ